jgi:hypothetical protein
MKRVSVILEFSLITGQSSRTKSPPIGHRPVSIRGAFLDEMQFSLFM